MSKAYEKVNNKRFLSRAAPGTNVEETSCQLCNKTFEEHDLFEFLFEIDSDAPSARKLLIGHTQCFVDAGFPG